MDAIKVVFLGECIGRQDQYRVDQRNLELGDRLYEDLSRIVLDDTFFWSCHRAGPTQSGRALIPMARRPCGQTFKILRDTVDLEYPACPDQSPEERSFVM